MRASAKKLKLLGHTCLIIGALAAAVVASLGSPAFLAVTEYQTMADPSQYTVQPGDTLSGIASTFGVSASAIQDANGLANPDALQAGMVLSIPGDQASQPTPPPDTKYTVKAGDSLSGIAAQFGVSASQIQSANGIQDPNVLRAGMVLTIPAGGQTAPAAATPTPAPPTPAPTPDVKYTVKAGDTLTGIASSFGVKASAIQSANNLQDGNAIKIGQLLTIPGATPPPAAPTPTPQPTAAPAATPAPTASPAPAAPQPSPTPQGDPRAFDQTGFRIDNDRFWEYFNRRGGVKTFGYPISKEFSLLGFRVQFFQRLVMQLRPDGTVATMNLLDDTIMPFTKANSSTFPAPDKSLADAAPKPGTDGYFDRLLGFVKDRSPNQWSDLPVNFYKNFNETVKYEDAYPDRKMDPGIMPAINLELWGAPISAPAFDPTNKNFVYQRFQRGIMHFDKTSGATQGLLLGDYLKSLMTGWNLPGDLAAQAKGSKFYMQYSPGVPNSLARPNDLPGTDLTGAFTRDGLVVLDPGHGGTEIGAAHIYPDGVAILEKDINLKIAMKTADLLRRAGRQVILTRTTDTQVNNPPKDLTGDGRMTLDDDLQARVDIANANGA
ncbi:MAG TPA: LysM peptidoglycan-binding domain-containing protein, partial [Chloroflexota bacterium]